MDEMYGEIAERGYRPEAGRSTLRPPAGISEGIPEPARACIAALESGGHSAWLVGGYVRDLLMGRTASDMDIATSAPVRSTARLLESAGWTIIPTGIKHGTITAISDGTAIEVTTYRCDGPYSDGRHPDSVRFVDSIDDDLARRDFTINAMALHPAHGLKDPFGGLQDLSRGVIRAVGDPHKRFSEDALRILRCLRFASQLSFTPEEETLRAAYACSTSLERIAAERIESELRKLICGYSAAHVLMEDHSILEPILPEISPMAGLDQKSPYHCFDVLEHTARALEAVRPDPELRYAALFHDIGKPSTMTFDENGRGHFYGHPQRSEEMARAIMRRLRMPKRMQSRIALLVREHDASLHPTERSIRRMTVKLEGDVDLLRKLIELKKADALAHAPGHTERAAEMAEVSALLESMIAASSALKRSDLAITGCDLLNMGMDEGPAVGKMLAALFEDVVEGRVENEREALLERARTEMGRR